MNTEENTENTETRGEIGVDAFEKSEIEVVDRKAYEITDWNGEEARFYPGTGAVMVFSEERKRWVIRANRGGRPDWDGGEMVIARELKKEKAIVEGLEKAGGKLDLRGATAVLSAIVASRAENAVSDDGRTGNADAKFIFSLVSENRETGETGPAVRIDMDREAAEQLINRLIEL